jgi:serine/threonine-protein kinase
MHANRATLVLATLLLAAPALADEGPPPRDNRARAQQLFDSALADAAGGNFAAACPKFQASQDADPKPSTLLNLASCYEKNGQSASAWGAFREAEGLARKAGRADWETTAHARAELLERKLVRLTVQVEAGSRVAGLAVTRDGAKLTPGEWGVSIPVDPGEHVVAATAPGRAPWETHVGVAVDATITVPMLELVPEAPLPAAPVAAPSVAPHALASWWTPLRTAGVVTAGVGVLGMATGAIVGLVAKGNYDDARARCTDGARACPASAVRDSSSAYDLSTVGTVVFVIGAAAAAAGVALTILAPSRAETPRSSASLLVGPGSASVVGRW